MHASLINAIYTISGPKGAMLAKISILYNLEVKGSVASFTQVLQNVRMNLELWNCKDCSAYTFDFLPLILDPIFTARVFFRKKINHTVCVDNELGIVINI